MKVKELIEILQTVDPDLEVIVDTGARYSEVFFMTKYEKILELKTYLPSHADTLDSNYIEVTPLT